MTTPAPTQPVDSIQQVPPSVAVEITDESDDDDGPTCMQAVLDALNTTASAFARKHGFNAGSIYNLANGTRATSYDLLWSICEVEPRISAEYLLRGEGNPLRDPSAIPIVSIQQMEQLRIDVTQLIERYTGLH